MSSRNNIERFDITSSNDTQDQIVFDVPDAQNNVSEEFNRSGNDEDDQEEGQQPNVSKEPPVKKNEESSKKRKAAHSKKKSKKRRRDSSPLSTSSESDSSSESNSEACYVNERFQITPKAEKSKWKLPSDMADYANRQFEVYIPDKDIEENVLENHPVPSNIQEVKSVDDFLRQY